MEFRGTHDGQITPTRVNRWVGKRKVASRTLVGLVSAVTAGSALAADFLVPVTARQHMRNPQWPGHAKFHNAQYIVMNGILGGIGLGLITSRKGSVERNLLTAAAIVSTPWIGMYGATVFPGTAVVDEEFAHLPHTRILGVDANLVVAASCLAALATSIGLLRRPGS